MKWIIVIALLAAGGYFAWTKFGPPQSPLTGTTTDKTPAANAQNRIEGLAGAAPAPE